VQAAAHSMSQPVGLSNPEGMRLARKLLRPLLPHDIHDYILEGICKAIDGSHVLAVIKTGGDDAVSLASFEEIAPEKSCHGTRISNKGASGGNGNEIPGPESDGNCY